LPQVCKILGYLIFFWSREDSEPPHVHVCKGKPHKDATKIWLESVPRLEHNKSEIPAKDLNRIMQWLAANREFVLAKWEGHFD
jgi:hypothetical protein